MRTILAGLCAGALLAGTAQAQDFQHSLTSTDGLRLINVQADVVTHAGREGLRVTRAEGYSEGGTLVLLEEARFENGMIELELAGEPAPWAEPSMRGFVGLAFRVDPADPGRYECFYLRPTNARADEQVRRNHSTQYVSHPEYPWHRLRQESPGAYESYVDLVPGEWTRVRIEVKGAAARLFVGDAAQPVLVVNDLKRGQVAGGIGLWLHSSTLAHYRDLRVSAEG